MPVYPTPFYSLEEKKKKQKKREREREWGVALGGKHALKCICYNTHHKEERKRRKKERKKERKKKKKEEMEKSKKKKIQNVFLGIYTAISIGIVLLLSHHSKTVVT